MEIHPEPIKNHGTPFLQKQHCSLSAALEKKEEETSMLRKTAFPRLIHETLNLFIWCIHPCGQEVWKHSCAATRQPLAGYQYSAGWHNSVRQPSEFSGHVSGFRPLPTTTRPLPLPAPLFLFVCDTYTHTNSQSSTRLFVSPSLSLFHSTEMIYFVSPLSSSSLQPPSGSASSSITLSRFLIPTLETPVPIQENNRLKNAAQAPSISPFSPSVSASLRPHNR